MRERVGEGEGGEQEEEEAVEIEERENERKDYVSCEGRMKSGGVSECGRGGSRNR